MTPRKPKTRKPKTRRAKKQKAQALPPVAYDRTPRAQLTLTDETLWLTRFDERGAPVGTFPVSVTDAANAFRGLGHASTGLLPADVLFWQSGSSPRLGLWMPPARRVITWGKGKRDLRLTVPLPGLVFVGRGRQYWVWAAAERPNNSLTALFQAPLPNVNPDGLICAGSVQFPTCAAETIHAAASLFFDSRFNSDLSIGRFNPAKRPTNPTARNAGLADDGSDDLLKFLQSLARAREFPLERLRPASATVATLLNEKPALESGRPDVPLGIDLDLEDDEEQQEELEAIQAELME